uniref:Uncharacterized protein n=1 Tax=Arundo donax TaxID=35708 RepID=A0A0A9BKT2_ARUDO
MLEITTEPTKLAHENKTGAHAR